MARGRHRRRDRHERDAENQQGEQVSPEAKLQALDLADDPAAREPLSAEPPVVDTATGTETSTPEDAHQSSTVPPAPESAVSDRPDESGATERSGDASLTDNHVVAKPQLSVSDPIEVLAAVDPPQSDEIEEIGTVQRVPPMTPGPDVGDIAKIAADAEEPNTANDTTGPGAEEDTLAQAADWFNEVGSSELLAEFLKLQASDPNNDLTTHAEIYSAAQEARSFRTDTDVDGVSDGDERAAGTDPTHPDTDRDGLTDGQEEEFGSNPLSADTDGDGIGDATEWAMGTLTDTDGDGISDLVETQLGTHPEIADSDGDGLADGQELEFDSDPLNWDTDNDGLSDGDEFVHDTDPLLADTDGDGRTDGYEVLMDTDPLLPD